MIRKLWTDEKPKTSGYYWFKSADGEWTDIVRVYRGSVYMPPSTSGVGIGNVVKLKHFAEGKWHGPIPFPQMRVVNKHESGLKDLTLAVVDCLAALDYAMERRESPERGSMVAKIANHLNNANDAAMLYGLGMDFDAINALKRKRERLRIKARKAKAGG